jgi:integrase
MGDGRRLEFAVASGPAGSAAVERDALSEYALWRTNPEGYQTPKARMVQVQRRGDRAAVRLDESTLEAFTAYCQDLVNRDQMSAGHLDSTLGPYLIAWMRALGFRDLHTLTLDDLQAALRRPDFKTARHKRIVALKRFTKWAREEKPAPKLRRQDDPTLDLKVPPVVAEKARRRKGYTVKQVEDFYPFVASQAARDMIRLRAFGNGMHDTEIDRLARGKGVLERVNDPSGIAGTITFDQKKKGETHVISLDAAAFAAAERLQARGKALSNTAYHAELKKAAIRQHGCVGVSQPVVRRKGGVDKRTGRDRTGEANSKIVPCPKCFRMQPNELRHSFATWATTIGEEVKPVGRKGVALDKVAERMGHKSKRTTSGFYVDNHVPDMIRVPVTLTHPEDPTP